jgi:hypothetical protein
MFSQEKGWHADCWDACRHNLYKLREERDMKPSTFGHLVSAVLYERRFGPYFASPVIAGLEPDNSPYICGMDSIGALETAKVGCACRGLAGKAMPAQGLSVGTSTCRTPPWHCWNSTVVSIIGGGPCGVLCWGLHVGISQMRTCNSGPSLVGLQRPVGLRMQTWL